MGSLTHHSGSTLIVDHVDRLNWRIGAHLLARPPAVEYTFGVDYSRLPGSNLIQSGLEDLRTGIESPEALLVAIGRPRLIRAGIPVPDHPFTSPEHRLYQHLWKTDPDSAHSRYNALVRRLVSFEQALECAG